MQSLSDERDISFYIPNLIIAERASDSSAGYKLSVVALGRA